MEFVTVHENDLVMSHLEKYPVWAEYTEDYSEEVLIAINCQEALNYACNPIYIAADFSFASGFENEGHVLVTEWNYEPYCVFIWSGKNFWGFNKDWKEAHSYALKDWNADTGHTMTLADVFPIRYSLRIPEGPQGDPLQTFGVFG
ncbi:hypothetical protein [Symmachiella dynata]|uniref:hypothetical protein n=1 Tax=Symmachiella dynata TaxID=2527995 RepID=UPI0030EB3119